MEGDGGECRAGCWAGIFVKDGPLHFCLRPQIVDRIQMALPCDHAGRIESAEIIRPVFKQTAFGERERQVDRIADDKHERPKDDQSIRQARLWHAVLLREAHGLVAGDGTYVNENGWRTDE